MPEVRAAIALLAMGCGSGEPSQAQAFALAMQQAQTLGAQACEGLKGRERADCVLSASSLSAEDCAGLGAGTWQDECRFQLAELRWHAKELELAAQACQGAGGYADSCLEHLWRMELPTLRDTPGGLQPALSASLTRRAWYVAYSPVRDAGAMVRNPWILQDVAMAHFAQQEQVDSGACGGLEERWQMPCRGAALALAEQLVVRGLEGAPPSPQQRCEHARGLRTATAEGSAYTLGFVSLKLQADALETLDALSLRTCANQGPTQGSGGP